MELFVYAYAHISTYEFNTHSIDFLFGVKKTQVLIDLYNIYIHLKTHSNVLITL